jgi:NAD-dependent dihydropyrimidine dehydrogenase PreA subunit
MPYVIAEPCLTTKDASCVEVCPVDCIYEGADQYYIHPDECIDCGACEPNRVQLVRISRTSELRVSCGEAVEDAWQNARGWAKSESAPDSPSRTR